MEVSNEQMQSKKEMNGFCLASLILAIVGITVGVIPCGIAAIVTGGIGLAIFNPETQNDNKWMAIVGIILSIVNIVIRIVTIIALLVTLFISKEI